MAITNSAGNRIINSIAGQTADLTITNTSNTASSSASNTISVAGSSAADAYIRYSISGVQQWTEGVDNSDSDAYVISASNTIGTTNALRIATDGIVNRPLTAGFLAVQTGSAANQTGDNTTFTFGGAGTITETYDIGSNFNTGTGQFTAPVTGIYLLSGSWFFQDLDAAHTIGGINFRVAGNGYRGWVGNAFNWAYPTSNFLIMNCSLVINMTAADVATFECSISGGTKVVDIGISNTWFAGQLIA